MNENKSWLNIFAKALQGERAANIALLKELNQIAERLGATFSIKDKYIIDDIVQEALFALLTKYRYIGQQNKSGDTGFKNLMYTIVKNLFRNIPYVRKRSKRLPAYSINEGKRDIMDTRPMPDESAEDKLRIAALEGCLRKLREKDEFKWLVFRAWSFVSAGFDEYKIPINHTAPELQNLMTDASDTQNILRIIRTIGQKHSTKFHLKSSTVSKTQTANNENTLKSHISRAKYILIQCLKLQGIFIES